MNFIQRYQPAVAWVNEINRFIDRSLVDPVVTAGPREVFHESDTDWILRLDLPGFSKQDVKLTVTARVMRVAAETPAGQPFGGKFEREWNLGEDVDTTGIRARLDNGVLELTLPKRTPVVPQPTIVEIQ